MPRYASLLTHQLRSKCVHRWKGQTPARAQHGPKTGVLPSLSVEHSAHTPSPGDIETGIAKDQGNKQTIFLICETHEGTQHEAHCFQVMPANLKYSMPSPFSEHQGTPPEEMNGDVCLPLEGMDCDVSGDSEGYLRDPQPMRQKAGHKR